MTVWSFNMVNLETKCAWDAHQEYFEYYAFECPEDWLELSKEYFTHEHGEDECSLIDWDYIKKQLKTSIDFALENDRQDLIPSADPYRAAFYDEV